MRPCHSLRVVGKGIQSTHNVYWAAGSKHIGNGPDDHVRNLFPLRKRRMRIECILLA